MIENDFHVGTIIKFVATVSSNTYICILYIVLDDMDNLFVRLRILSLLVILYAVECYTRYLAVMTGATVNLKFPFSLTP